MASKCLSETHLWRLPQCTSPISCKAPLLHIFMQQSSALWDMGLVHCGSSHIIQTTEPVKIVPSYKSHNAPNPYPIMHHFSTFLLQVVTLWDMGLVRCIVGFVQWVYMAKKRIWLCANIGSGNGLLPDSTKPLPEPLFPYHISKVQWHSSEGRFARVTKPSLIEIKMT